jgi:lipopolysaccharide-induced tumor necrosis factor-alpha factor
MQQGQYPMQYQQPHIQGQPVYYGNQPGFMAQGIPLSNMGERANYDEENDALPTYVRSKHPREFRCPNCRRRGVTITKHEPGTGSWLLCVGLVCFGCWICALLPCCVEDCQDTKHFCPNCGADAGKKQFCFDS